MSDIVSDDLFGGPGRVYDLGATLPANTADVATAEAPASPEAYLPAVVSSPPDTSPAVVSSPPADPSIADPSTEASPPAAPSIASETVAATPQENQ